MSIQEFTAALRTKANATINNEAKALLDRFAASADSAFNAGGILKKASIISAGKATVSGKTLQLSGEFRSAGEKQGRTRLILTEDDLNGIFKQFNIKAEASPIALYANFLATNYGTKLARHYEVYLRDGSVIERGKAPIAEVLRQIDPSEIVAIRGLNFSHDNTLKHVAKFLSYIGAFPGKSTKEVESTLAGEYDRGHVYAQTTGRAIISSADIAEEDNILNQIIGLYKLLDEGSTSLNSLDGKYNTLLARAEKDFSAKHVAMNIQLQIKRDIETGLGNRDTGDISTYVQIVKFLQKLVQGSKLSSDGKRQLGQVAAVSLKEFEAALTDLDTKLGKYQEQISRVIARTNNPNYLMNLRTSDTIKEYSMAVLKDIIGGRGSKRVLKVTTPNIAAVTSEKLKTKVSSPGSKVSQSLALAKNKLKKLEQELATAKNVKISAQGSKQTNLSSLLAVLNSQIQDVVSANMGSGSNKEVLNYRTGRFASSVNVERLTQSREGMITAFYSYMQNPYATFSDGGKQSSPKSRDPKLLISKSIREIAAQRVANRMRAVLA